MYNDTYIELASFRTQTNNMPQKPEKRKQRPMATSAMKVLSAGSAALQCLATRPENNLDAVGRNAMLVGNVGLYAFV